LKENIPTPVKKAGRCLGLFAKDPLAGEAKTRLGSVYDKNFRRELAESFLKDMLRVADGLENTGKVLVFSPPRSAGRMGRYLPPGWGLLAQEGDDLGRKMESFFGWAFKNGYRQAILIGSDFPSLPPQFLNQAFELLNTKPLVLGPTTDGGYYLVGMCRYHPEIFREIDWSSSKVFSQTVDRLKGNPGLLPPWYDVDYPDDLTMLAGHLKGMLRAKQDQLPKDTINFLRQNNLLSCQS
jgi:rSAM/selenodomain-associated transferase 1